MAKLKEREMIGYECLLAHKKIFSTGCPYLALSDQLGYLTVEAVWRRIRPNWKRYD